MAINPMDYSAKDTVLDVVRTERAKFYTVIDVPQNWESPTRSGHWEVRDLVGHMIDVTEGYLTRWDMARRGDPATPLGLLVMASELDRVALTFRNLPRDEAISRLKASSDRLMNHLRFPYRRSVGRIQRDPCLYGAAPDVLLSCLPDHGLWRP